MAQTSLDEDQIRALVCGFWRNVRVGEGEGGIRTLVFRGRTS